MTTAIERLAAKRARERLAAAEARLAATETRVISEAEQEVARVVARLTSQMAAQANAIVAPTGATGPAGAEGKRGPKGEKGEKGDPPRHEWRGTSLRFEQPDGSWGRYVNLLGPAGARGLGGGGSGSSGLDVSDLAPLPAPALDTDQIVIVREGVPYLVSVGVLQEIFGGGGDVPATAVRVNGELVKVNGQIVVVNES